MKKLSKYKNYDEWVVDILQSDKKRADLFLDIAIKQFEKDDDVAALLVALSQVVKAKGGFSKFAHKSKLNRESLYNILSKEGNPTLLSFKNIINALGCKIIIKHSVSGRARKLSAAL